MSKSEKNEELLDEARVYEAVLVNLPHDEFALNRLVEIYTICGDDSKSTEFKQRLEIARQGELDIEEFHVSNLRPGTKAFFKNHSKIHELISLCKKEETKFFKSRISEWSDIRPHLDFLIRLKDAGALDLTSYVELCRHFMNTRNQKKNSHWKGVVSHLPDCDRLNYSDVLEALKRMSGMEYVDLTEFHYSNELELLPKKLISHCELLIFSVTKSEVSVALLNPFNEVVKKVLRDYFTLPVKFYLTDVQSFNTFAKGS